MTPMDIPAKSPTIAKKEKGSPKANRKNNRVGQLIISKPKFETAIPRKKIAGRFPIFMKLNSPFSLEEIIEPEIIPIVVRRG